MDVVGVIRCLGEIGSIPRAATVCGAMLLASWPASRAQDATVVAATKDEAGAHVAADGASKVIGSWTGKIVGRRIASMAHLRIDLAAVGMPAGNSEYHLQTVTGFNRLACRGYLQLVSANGSSFTFKETLTEPGDAYEGGCPIAGTLKLLVKEDGIADGEWIEVNAKKPLMMSGDLTTNCCSEAMDVTSAKAKALTAQLTALLQRIPGIPERNDKRYVDEDLGVSFDYPADYELVKAERPVIAALRAPSQSSVDADRTEITVTMSKPIARLLSPSLDLAVNATLEGTREALAESTLAGPVPAKMGGTVAQVFFVTGKSGGTLRQKAVTIAVVDKNVLGVVLHAKPETFEAAWEAYQRVVASYAMD